MATLYIAEFGSMGDTGQGIAQIGAAPPLAEQTLTIAGASAPSAAFGNDTQMVRLHTDAICSVAFGTTPVATAAKMRMGANTTEYFGVLPGSKVAVIVNT